MRRAGLIPVVVLILAEACAAHVYACAGGDDSGFEYQTKHKVKAAPSPAPRNQAKLKDEFDPKIHDIEGDFNDCAALHLIRLELSRRDDRMGEPSKLSEKGLRQLNSSRSLQTKLKALTDRTEEGCKVVDQKTAEAVIQVYKLVIDFPEHAREGAANAPLSLYAAVRVCQSLNEFPEIHTNRDLVHVPPLCFGAPNDEAGCNAEATRRGDIDRTLKRVFQDDVFHLLKD
jgi:hypothetical protein